VALARATGWGMGELLALNGEEILQWLEAAKDILPQPTP